MPGGNPGRRKLRTYTVRVEPEHFILLARGTIVELRTEGGALVRLMPGQIDVPTFRARALAGEIPTALLALISDALTPGVARPVPPPE